MGGERDRKGGVRRGQGEEAGEKRESGRGGGREGSQRGEGEGDSSVRTPLAPSSLVHFITFYHLFINFITFLSP